jgi:translation initiation factor 5B
MGLTLLLQLAGNAIEQSRMYGRHFDHNDQLVSKITRESINALKAHFADEMTKDDWRLVSNAGFMHAGFRFLWFVCV